jgi:hypothetical protein
MKAIRTIGGAALLGLALSGCYELSEPVIDKGSRAGLAGAFRCANQMDGSKGSETIEEIGSGFIFKSYKYRLSDGSEISAEAIKDRFFLAQASSKQKLNVLYIDVTDAGFSVMIPNLMTQSAAIDLLAGKYGVTFRHNASGTVALQGDKSKIRDFLKGHSAAMMTPVMSCVRA